MIKVTVRYKSPRLTPCGQFRDFKEYVLPNDNPETIKEEIEDFYHEYLTDDAEAIVITKNGDLILTALLFEYGWKVCGKGIETKYLRINELTKF